MISISNLGAEVQTYTQKFSRNSKMRLQEKKKKASMVVHTFNPSTLEAKTGGSL